MFYSNLSKTVALSVGVLAMVFLISYFVFAWQEPTQAPPLGNVPAPLNVSSISQVKTGHLTVNSFISGTRVGIGMTPIYPLDVSGDVRWSGTLRGGTVPWARLTFFPSSCPAGQYVSGVGSSLTCSTPASSGMTYWNIAADGTSGSATVGQDQTVTIRGGTGITATRSTRDVTASLAYPTKSCSSGYAIQSFNLGSSASPTCVEVGGGGLTGSGTTNYIPLWTGSTSLGNSVIRQSESRIGIGINPAYTLDVAGNARITSHLRANESLTVGGNISAPNNVRENCEWTAWTCDYFWACPSGNPFVSGVARGTGLSICGTGSNRWYQMSLYCCQI